MQRFQPPAGAADPVAQRGTIQRHALAGEDLRLAIQWQMVGIFADQDMRQQRLGRHAAVYRPVWCGRLHDGLLAPLVCHSIGFADGTLSSLARQP
jgi:hypothetical protein